MRLWGSVWASQARRLRPALPYDACAVEQRLDNVDEDAVREAEEARAIRARRDARLTPEERLQRTAELCRQLALIRPADQG